VHLLCADLDFERLPALPYDEVWRLVEVRPRNGNVVLYSTRDRFPEVVQYTQDGVAVPYRIGDHPDGDEVIDFVYGDLLRRILL